MTDTATSTSKFHEYYVIDRDRDENRAMVVYRAMERDEFRPMYLVMDVTTGTRWVTTNTPSCHEVVVHELSFNEQVDELFDSAVFAISNDADDRASLQLTCCDSFNDVTIVMCEVEWGLNEYGFKWYTVSDSEQARDMMDMHDALVIEVTENGCHVFRG